jgi:hypothetical protein
MMERWIYQQSCEKKSKRKARNEHSNGEVQKEDLMKKSTGMGFLVKPLPELDVLAALPLSLDVAMELDRLVFLFRAESLTSQSIEVRFTNVALFGMLNPFFAVGDVGVATFPRPFLAAPR